MNIKKHLLRHGISLFLLGLLTGILVPALLNPRMGVSAHLEGVLNGMFLVLLGVIWQDLNLSKRTGSILYRLVLYGTYANWLATLLSAVFGTSRLTPIAGAGFMGAPWQEIFVAAGLISLSAAMIVSCILILRGLCFSKGR